MNKKLLVVTGVLGAAAVTVYIFRDRLLAGALELGDKLTVLTEDQGWDAEDDDAIVVSAMKESE